MIDALSQIRWLAVLLASVAHFALAAIWFTVLFGNRYAQALGLTEAAPSKPARASSSAPSCAAR